VPDEFFVGYGFDLDDRWRGLPDLRVVNRTWRSVQAAGRGAGLREARDPDTRRARGIPPPPARLDRRRDSRRRNPLRRLYL